MLKYNEFIHEQIDNSVEDKDTNLYLEGKITFEEWENKFNKINEGLGDLIKTKIYSVLNSLKTKIKTIGEKGIKILSSIFNFIKTFASKQPILAKMLVIVIIFFVIGIVSASADPSTLIPNSDVLNAAIGFVEELNQDGTIADVMDKMQVQAYLVDIRNDGVMDENWSEQVQKIGDTATKMMEDLKDKNPDKFSKLADFGAEIKDYIFKVIKSAFGSSTNVSLSYI